MKRTWIITGQQARDAICSHVQSAPLGYCASLGISTRTLEQNALLWPLLQTVADSVEWYGQYLTKEEWKDVFSASLKKQKAVPGIDGGFVVCGQSTSKMTKREFSDLIELIRAFCAERGVELERMAA